MGTVTWKGRRKRPFPCSDEGGGLCGGGSSRGPQGRGSGLQAAPTSSPGSPSRSPVVGEAAQKGHIAWSTQGFHERAQGPVGEGGEGSWKNKWEVFRPTPSEFSLLSRSFFLSCLHFLFKNLLSTTVSGAVPDPTGTGSVATLTKRVTFQRGGQATSTVTGELTTGRGAFYVGRSR